MTNDAKILPFNDPAFHIAELRRWLQSHETPTTSQGRMARADRLKSLDMWLKRLQQSQEAKP